MVKDSKTEIKCCDEPLEFRAQKGWQGWEAYKPEKANCRICKTYFERKSGNNMAYKMNNENQSYNCTTCNRDILSETVAHPIWDGPFPMSGSGKCHYETVPYCPKCEKKPDFREGAGINIGDKFS